MPCGCWGSRRKDAVPFVWSNKGIAMKLQHLAIGIALFALTGISHGAGHAHDITPKPGAAVAVQRADEGPLSVGIQTRLNLRFTGQPDSVLTVEYRPEDGLVLHSPATVQLRSDLQGVATDAPTVEAVTDGVHYLNVFVTQGERSRAISIRVTAGDAARALRKPGGPGQAAPASPGVPGVTSQGEPLVILPAAE